MKFAYKLRFKKCTFLHVLCCVMTKVKYLNVNLSKLTDLIFVRYHVTQSLVIHYTNKYLCFHHVTCFSTVHCLCSQFIVTSCNIFTKSIFWGNVYYKILNKCFSLFFPLMTTIIKLIFMMLSFNQLISHASWVSFCNWQSLNTNYYGTTFNGMTGSFTSSQTKAIRSSYNCDLCKTSWTLHKIKYCIVNAFLLYNTISDYFSLDVYLMSTIVQSTQQLAGLQRM